MKSLMVMWILSLVTAVGTGWLAFSTSGATPVVHALFLLAVCAFAVCSIWTLARGLSPLREHPPVEPPERAERPEDRGAPREPRSRE